MGKLFVSLYIYIIVSLFIASGVIGQFWPDEPSQEILLDDELGQSLWLLSHTPDGLKKLNDTFESQIIARGALNHNAQ